jgi:hypothetical protein
MPQPTPPVSAPSSAPARPGSNQLKIYGAWFLAGLLIGLIPTGISLFQTQRERDALRQQLQIAHLELHLSSAAVLARHGDYEAARDSASRFFSDAAVAVDTSGNDLLTALQRTSLQSALTDRDAMITLLARGDPAGAERLTAMYVAHRAAFPR